MARLPLFGADNSPGPAEAQFVNRPASDCFHCKIEITRYMTALIDHITPIAY